VETQLAKVVLPESDEHDFKPEGVVDSNEDLVIVNK
jgi:hypothetical protein